MIRILLALLVSLLPMLGYQNASATPGMAGTIVYVEEFYESLFAASGKEWISPTMILVGEGEAYDGACGKAESGEEFAFYCPMSREVVIDAVYMASLAEEHGDLIPATAISHEYFHHVQNITDMDTASIAPTQDDPDWDLVMTIERELTADCMAGAFFAYLDERDLISTHDVAEVIIFSPNLGDSDLSLALGGGRTGILAHGTGLERATALLRGYEEGIFGCMTINPQVQTPYTG